MQTFIDFENLETKIHTGNNTKISFLENDKIELRSGIEEDSDYVIDIVVPWGNIYNLGRYDNEASAKSDFDKFHDYLNKGYNIHITSVHTAEIISDNKNGI